MNRRTSPGGPVYVSGRSYGEPRKSAARWSGRNAAASILGVRSAAPAG